MASVSGKLDAQRLIVSSKDGKIVKESSQSQVEQIVFSSKHQSLLFVKSDGCLYKEDGSRVEFATDKSLAFCVDSQTLLQFKIENGKICGQVQATEL